MFSLHTGLPDLHVSYLLQDHTIVETLKVSMQY